MSSAPPQSSVPADVWSALSDGEADPGDLDAALAGWRAATAARECHPWHAYHLIGDALRSNDLAVDRQRDQRLLEAVRQRLASEPVVLAPAAVSIRVEPSRRATVRRWRTWSGAGAMAAGVGAVALMMWMAPGVGPTESDRTLAQRPASVVPVATAVGGSAVLATSTASGAMLRDARLDEYLAAHRQLGAGRALGTPAGYLAERAAAAR